VCGLVVCVVCLIGRGQNFILNMPPNRTGVIPYEYAAEGKRFGDALRATMNSRQSVIDKVVNCSEAIVFTFSAASSFDMVILSEDMGWGV